MEFEWDERKAEANLDKHGVSFEEVTAIWDDVNLLIVPARHRLEKRFLAIGSVYIATYTVVHTERGDAIRIISARLATDKERRAYERSKR